MNATRLLDNSSYRCSFHFIFHPPPLSPRPFSIGVSVGDRKSNLPETCCTYIVDPICESVLVLHCFTMDFDDDADGYRRIVRLGYVGKRVFRSRANKLRSNEPTRRDATGSRQVPVSGTMSRETFKWHALAAATLPPSHFAGFPG